MNNERKKTEQLLQIYKEDMAKENLSALLHQMKKTIFLVPAMLPDTPEVREVKQRLKENPGEKVSLPQGIAPMPAVLTNQKGEKFFPVYSSAEQVAKEPKADLLINMPFFVCCRTALDKRLGVQGIAVNPFTDNLRLKGNLIEAVLREEAAKQNAKQVKLTPGQYQVRMRQKAEFHDFPLRAFKEGKEFILRLSEEKEALVNEVYKNAYQKGELYPYDESSFSVMALNISEEMLLVWIDLPPVREAAQLCHRAYLTLNPKKDEIHYFTIERGKEEEERNLGGVNAAGEHIEYGEAPVEGAEIQRILDLIAAEGKGN